MFTNNRSLLSIESTAVTLEKLVDALSNSQRYTILTFIDVSLFLTSIGAAIGFEWGFGFIPMEIWQHSSIVLLKIAVGIGLFWATKE